MPANAAANSRAPARVVSALEHLSDDDGDDGGGGAAEVEVSFGAARTAPRPSHSSTPYASESPVGVDGRTSALAGERGGAGAAHASSDAANAQEWGGRADAVTPRPAGSAATPPPLSPSQLPGATAVQPSALSHLGTPALPALISAADYADRQRLLYHITSLSTQLQRTTLQLEAQQRTITILQAAAAASAAGTVETAARSGSQPAAAQHRQQKGEEEVAADEDAVTLRLPARSESTTAAVLAARSEQELQAALARGLSLFDPVVAEESIYRLDNALAHLGLLRQSELAQLAQAEEERQELRHECVALASAVDALREERDRLHGENATLHSSNESAQLEVQRLRAVELELTRKVAGMEGFLQGEGTPLDGVQAIVHLPRQRGDGSDTVTAREHTRQRSELFDEEAVTRLYILQEQLYEPMLMAFDAGLTWLSETRALTVLSAAVHTGHSSPNAQGQEAARSLAMAAAAAPTDAGLLQLRAQQEENASLKSKATVLQERLRMSRLETERLSFLYEGEQRRSEALAADHARQLQQAFEELMKDRQQLAEQLKAEVEEQMRVAFRDGRKYERFSQLHGHGGASPAMHGSSSELAEAAHGPSAAPRRRQQMGPSVRPAVRSLIEVSSPARRAAQSTSSSTTQQQYSPAQQQQQRVYAPHGQGRGDGVRRHRAMGTGLDVARPAIQVPAGMSRGSSPSDPSSGSPS